jgi:hypothetical protein
LAVRLSCSNVQRFIPRLLGVTRQVVHNASRRIDIPKARDKSADRLRQ